ncbi:hexokinase-4-like isoform X2 [Watersipora subatra]|uniref:hexokinase-4-like isoform X2 n=1 Tax=Watersipora subatra TaxID=2589382 RepID=UPI00355B79FC
MENGDSVIHQLRVTLPNNDEFCKVKEEVDKFMLNEEQMNSIMAVMESEMKLGLSRHKEDREKSSLQMENTFVHQTIDGTEHGDYLALDLGGTNFRVIFIEMREGKLMRKLIHYYEIPERILTGTGKELFDYLADSIAALLTKENITTTTDQAIPLGFTFSFPMIQSSLTSALLLTWTKKFKCSDTEMKDVVLMLEEAIARRGDINVSIVAILNDTVATLMTGAYEDDDCYIGVILGTGSNAAYLEHLERVDKWTGNTRKWSQEIIDIEWGAFGDNGVLDFFKTEYDFEIDRQSNHKGSFTFEKLFGGLYLGELVRLTLADLTQKKLMFTNLADSQSDWVNRRGSFPTAYVSTIEGDSGDGKTIEVLQKLGMEKAGSHDVAIVRYICALVSNRAAKIVVSALTVLLRHIKKEKVTVAVDGSLFSCHPTLRQQMESLIAYTAPDTATKFLEVKDGSGMGAAYVAAVADRINKQRESS